MNIALNRVSPPLSTFVIAINDPGRRHDYPPAVRFEIKETELSSYRRAADFLNVNDVDVVSLQHEYGIFGGRAGSHLLVLLRELRMPLVTTLHTILSEPSAAQRLVLDEVLKLSERIVVMSRQGKELLHQVHGVSLDKIDLIPHGIPELPQARASKEHIGVTGKRVLLTFGLLSPDKGIEHAISAMALLRDEFPNALYIVLGATHPHIKERQGEAYRLMLEQHARHLGVDESVIFHDRFVSQEELIEFLSAADVYVTPYLKAEQITSGTLAYALGSGKAVVSTPYWYAEELLADGRGLLVPWRDPKAIASAVSALFSNDQKRLQMCTRAAAYGKEMLWPAVAQTYLNSFERALTAHRRNQNTFHAKTLAERPAELPDSNLSHVIALTDSTGILQHAQYSVPRYRDGYCLDDNTRALLLTTLLDDADTCDHRITSELASRYLAFVAHAFDVEGGRFRNFMSYERQWLEEAGSEDSHGRAVWALGTVVGRSKAPGHKSLSGMLFRRASEVTHELRSPRAWAFSVLGLGEYLQAFRGESGVEALRAQLAERLLSSLLGCESEDWCWFENSVTYENARLPQALLNAGVAMHRKDMVDGALRSLAWLMEHQLNSRGEFAPIGSEGFFVRGGEKSHFDQQPVDAWATLCACHDALRTTGDPKWKKHASKAFSWFLGDNALHTPLYDSVTGGCRDGLHPDRSNENQGAESTLAFQCALVEMRELHLHSRPMPRSTNR